MKISAERREDFVLERYKYILEQKKFVNNRTFAVVSFFQGGLILLASGQYAVAKAAFENQLSLELGQIASRALFWLLVVLAFFSCLIVLSGVASWLNYRKEESEIESLFMSVARPPPSLAQVLRWYETYVLLAIIATVCGVGWLFYGLR